MARISPNIRTLVRQRARRRCEYCLTLESFSPDTFTMEHIQPQILQGSNEAENLALSCQQCNRNKYTATEAIDPQTNTRTPIYNPRLDDWKTHFRWSLDFLEIEGITPSGRATIALLELNREGVVNLRRVLRISGEDHPPIETL
jgi:hypothetical protein